MRNSFQTLWEREHEIICHHKQIEVHNPPKRQPKGKMSCLEARTCICNDDGDTLWDMKLWFGFELSKVSSKRVKDGDVVVRLRGYQNVEDGDEEVNR